MLEELENFHNKMDELAVDEEEPFEDDEVDSIEGDESNSARKKKAPNITANPSDRNLANQIEKQVLDAIFAELESRKDEILDVNPTASTRSSQGITLSSTSPSPTLTCDVDTSVSASESMKKYQQAKSVIQAHQTTNKEPRGALSDTAKQRAVSIVCACKALCS